MAAAWDRRGGPGRRSQGKPTGSPLRPSWRWGAPAPCSVAARAGEDPASPTLPTSNIRTPLTARHRHPGGRFTGMKATPSPHLAAARNRGAAAPGCPREGPCCCVGAPGLRITPGAAAPRSAWGEKLLGKLCDWGKTAWKQVSEERANPPACPASWGMWV